MSRERTVHVGIRPSEARLLAQLINDEVAKNTAADLNYIQNLRYLARLFESVAK